jgi:hypothetical protein
MDRGNQLSTWERNKLDAEQEVAFEVLTATYVLTLTMKQTTIWTIRLQLNSSRTRTAFWNWQDETHDKQRISLCECSGPPELANVSNNIILYCLSQLFPMMLTNPFSSAKLLEEVLAYAKLQSKYQPSFQQTICVTAMTGAAAMEIGSNNSFGIPLHAKQKLCYAR